MNAAETVGIVLCVGSFLSNLLPLFLYVIFIIFVWIMCMFAKKKYG
ncbi:hypothetical protein [Fluviispira vulneris]|nr:hypothetical protein [Fluviispira vulneris]